MAAEPAAPPCIFCEIVAGRAPAYRVYEDEATVVFLDIFPFTRGHLLVVPRRHVDRITDLDPSEYPGFLTTVAEMCRRVDRLSRHYNVALNQGALAGQIVFHLHLHLIPRYGETNPFLAPHRERLTDTEAAAVLRDLHAGSAG